MVVVAPGVVVVGVVVVGVVVVVGGGAGGAGGQSGWEFVVVVLGSTVAVALPPARESLAPFACETLLSAL